jgi:hypothetical protein
MKKLAVFVEGQTEQIFIEKLLLGLLAKATSRSRNDTLQAANQQRENYGL